MDVPIYKEFVHLMMWDELESLWIHPFPNSLARFGGFVWNMVPSIYPWSSLRVHLAAASAPVSDLGIRRESVQDAIQKFMYHDDVRPKRPVMGWDLWCYVGGADGSCQKKHRFHGILATFNDLIHPESEAIYRFSLENDNLGWSLACWWNTTRRHLRKNDPF